MIQIHAHVKSEIGNLNIPVYMISQRDGGVVDKLLIHNRGSMEIKVSVRKCEDFGCSICQEEMAVGEEILKLHCRHCYHRGEGITYLWSSLLVRL